MRPDRQTFLSTGNIVRSISRLSQRRKVAQEAAELLYTGQEKEYKQAKQRALRTMGGHFLPSNLEVATELDRISEEREGKARGERLAQKRIEALQIMQALRSHYPILVGSVWRGTANRNSDIDIIAYARNPQQVVSTLQKHCFLVNRMETKTVTKKGEKQDSLHIYLDLTSDHRAEIVVRPLERIGERSKCEIYGDTVRGLTTQKLKQVLRQNPQRRFTPTYSNQP